MKIDHAVMFVAVAGIAMFSTGCSSIFGGIKKITGDTEPVMRSESSYRLVPREDVNEVITYEKRVKTGGNPKRQSGGTWISSKYKVYAASNQGIPGVLGIGYIDMDRDWINEPYFAMDPGDPFYEVLLIDELSTLSKFAVDVSSAAGANPSTEKLWFPTTIKTFDTFIESETELVKSAEECSVLIGKDAENDKKMMAGLIASIKTSVQAVTKNAEAISVTDNADVLAMYSDLKNISEIKIALKASLAEFSTCVNASQVDKTTFDAKLKAVEYNAESMGRYVDDLRNPDARKTRDYLAGILIVISNHNANVFLSRVFTNKAYFDTMTTWLSDSMVALGGAVNSFSPNLGTGLNAGSLYVNKTYATANKNIFGGETYAVMESAIRNGRDNQIKAIKVNLAKSYDDYPVSELLSDIDKLDEMCSIKGGLRLMQAAVDAQKK